MLRGQETKVTERVFKSKTQTNNNKQLMAKKKDKIKIR